MTQRNDHETHDGTVDDFETTTPNPAAPAKSETTPNSYERGLGGEEGGAGSGWHDNGSGQDQDRS
ncbi:hypothetical protein [Deinococcus yavapaiensis]|uniref:Uncharacterized protein n=1 Tax=Deinococcus yavapaiensis KR-236 TaxID=694435 RepID=A0A318S5Q8_9DEIO|nr:hypothetical protein [Deinococcus yavapaiensis]PYE51143.1 hypothetical protein DES52_11575 [Deinococcus yavapaiensis KR-236]